MPKAIKLTLARLKEILRRQDPPQWGKQYDPAIRTSLVGTLGSLLPYLVPGRAKGPVTGAVQSTVV